MTQVFHLMELFIVYSYKDLPSNLELLHYLPILKYISLSLSLSQLLGQDFITIHFIRRQRN